MFRFRRGLRRGEALALIGALLQIGSLIGLLVTAAWQIHAFNGLSKNTSLDSLAGILSASTLAFGIFIFLFIGSLVCVCIALAVLRCRAVWFFCFLATYSWLLLLSFPVGTAAGLFFLIYTLPRRSEFIPANRTV